MHPAPNGLDQARPIVILAIRLAGASADVLVGRTPHGFPTPGSRRDSYATLTWQEELDLSSGPSRERLCVRVRQWDSEKKRETSKCEESVLLSLWFHVVDWETARKPERERARVRARQNNPEKETESKRERQRTQACVSVCVYMCCPVSFSLSVSVCLSLCFCACSLSRSLSLTHTYTHTHTHIHAHTHTLSLSLWNIPTFSLFHSPTHAHAHRLSLTHTYTYTQYISLSPTPPTSPHPLSMMCKMFINNRKS